MFIQSWTSNLLPVSVAHVWYRPSFVLNEHIKTKWTNFKKDYLALTLPDRVYVRMKRNLHQKLAKQYFQHYLCRHFRFKVISMTAVHGFQIRLHGLYRPSVPTLARIRIFGQMSLFSNRLFLNLAIFESIWAYINAFWGVKWGQPGSK